MSRFKVIAVVEFEVDSGTTFPASQIDSNEYEPRDLDLFIQDSVNEWLANQIEAIGGFWLGATVATKEAQE